MAAVLERTLQELVEFLERLRKANITHSVKRADEYALVRVEVASERWEVEFFSSAPLEVEVFVSTGRIEGSQAFDRLFERFSDVNNS